MANLVAGGQKALGVHLNHAGADSMKIAETFVVTEPKKLAPMSSSPKVIIPYDICSFQPSCTIPSISRLDHYASSQIPRIKIHVGGLASQ